MRNLTATLCLTLAVLLGSVEMSWSVDFEKGSAAYRSGDYSTALREWEPLADQVDASAQNYLGVKHHRQQGVPQNTLSNSKGMYLGSLASPSQRTTNFE